MERDLQVCPAKETSLYEPEVDVLMSEPLYARDFLQALGEPPMQTSGDR